MFAVQATRIVNKGFLVVAMGGDVTQESLLSG